MVVALCVFALLRSVASIRHPFHVYDTASYMHLNFLGDRVRLWVVPLVYNVLPSDGLREGFQILLGIGCWSTLAVSVTRSVSHRGVAAAGFVLVLLLGLVPQVTVWDGVLIAESISTSLFVLLVALLLLARASPWWIAVALGVLGVWLFTKQENDLTFLMLLVPSVLFAWWRLPRRMAVATITGVRPRSSGQQLRQA